MQVDVSSPRRVSATVDNANSDTSATAFADEERGGHDRHQSSHASSQHNLEESTELRTRPNSIAESQSGSQEPNGGNDGGSAAGKYLKRKTSQLMDVFSSGSSQADVPLSPLLAQLVQSYASSQIAADIRASIGQTGELSDPTSPAGGTNGEGRDIVEESVNVRGRRRASYATQFRILSGRAFKNLYRNPALLTAHYISSIGIARKSHLVTRTSTMFYGF